MLFSNPEVSHPQVLDVDMGRRSGKCNGRGSQSWLSDLGAASAIAASESRPEFVLEDCTGQTACSAGPSQQTALASAVDQVEASSKMDQHDKQEPQVVIGGAADSSENIDKESFDALAQQLSTKTVDPIDRIDSSLSRASTICSGVFGGEEDEDEFEPDSDAELLVCSTACRKQQDDVCAEEPAEQLNVCQAEPQRLQIQSAPQWLQTQSAPSGQAADERHDVLSVVRGNAAVAESDELLEQIRAREERLPEQMLDELDRIGVAGDNLQAWHFLESKTMQAFAKAGAEGCPLSLRTLAIGFMRDIAGLCNIGFKGACDIILLFDHYCRGRQITVELLPALCIAVVRAVDKLEKGSSSHRWNGMCEKIASGFVERLRAILQADVDPVTDEQVDELELVLVFQMDHSIATPSTCTWLNAYGKRFDIVSGGRLHTTLEWVMMRSTHCAQVMAFCYPTTCEFSPRRVSNALFCLCLGMAGILPLNEYKPSKLSQSEWQDSVIKCWSSIAGIPAANSVEPTYPVCSLPPDHWQAIMEILQVSTYMDNDGLRNDTAAFIEHVLAFMPSQDSQDSDPNESSAARM